MINLCEKCLNDISEHDIERINRDVYTYKTNYFCYHTYEISRKRKRND